MFNTLRLQHYPPTFILTPGSSRHLCHQLKGTFVRTEIRIVQHGVGIQNTYYTYMVKVQPFRHHLRTNQYICFPLFKIGDNLFIGSTGTGSIQIHAGHSRFREKNLNIIFNLFRSKTTIDQFCTFAGGTGFRQLIGIAAIMACQLVDSLMISQAHIAVLTFRHPAASTTFYHRCKSAAILKENDLFFLLQCLFHVLYQQR